MCVYIPLPCQWLYKPLTQIQIPPSIYSKHSRIKLGRSRSSTQHTNTYIVSIIEICL